MTVALDQPRAALERGNQMRLRRAAMKRDVKSWPTAEGAGFIAGLLRLQVAGGSSSDLDLIEGMRVAEVMVWPNRMGAHSVRKLAVAAGRRVATSAVLRVRELTPVEAAAIADVLEQVARGTRGPQGRKF